jgi:hypothetical protein
MPFTLPNEFQKALSKNSQTIYKSKLNALAKEGYDTVELLKKKQKDVIEAIKKITGDGDTEKDRYARRVFLSAIFWVVKLPAKNQYHTYWGKCIPLRVAATDDAWLSKKAYDKENK